MIARYDEDKDGKLSVQEYAGLYKDQGNTDETRLAMAGPFKISDFNGKSFKV